ncbi:vWA domain-containing protein [Halalkalirubrum salinum]|uniref:vWA domain-containing protein n=1 Tax=Halalkalirubrum salinum TaxID=2563889 RepID=UPI0010FB7D17|nr:vWA domain-containing protein [Halalkalirubrum salinum]
MDAHITFVLDSSGSMHSIADDTIGGFNAFLDEQRAEDGAATVSLFDFDDRVSQVYRGMDLREAENLTRATYTPGGQTALHDAMLQAITDTEQLLAERDATPETVVIVVLTDGQENASQTPIKPLREQIKAKQTGGWEFLFIGANQDAVLAASEFGVTRDRALTMDHSGDGAKSAIESTSRIINEIRNDGFSDGYQDADRDRQRDAS